MTQTQAARPQARYRGVVYGIDLLDHASVVAGAPLIVPNDYVGKTRQRGRLRENQHRDTQPFSDLIVGSPRVLWEGICTEAELDEMERHFIQDVEQRPRMNWKLNEDNPEQVPKWVQLEQRHERDDREGRPRWLPPDERKAASLLEWRSDQSTLIVPVRRVSVPRKWTAPQVNALVWSGVWVATAGIIWGVLDRHGLFGSWAQRSVFGAVAAAALIAWSLAGAPVTGRQWKTLRCRWRRRVSRWWSGAPTRRSRRR